MFVDMPPGTGDVTLTVFQSIPVDGAIVVSSPQDLVSMVVKKSITMAGMMHINVLGVIENMAYITCPDCGKKIKIFGETPLDCLAAMMGVNLLDELLFVHYYILFSVGTDCLHTQYISFRYEYQYTVEPKMQKLSQN